MFTLSLDLMLLNVYFLIFTFDSIKYDLVVSNLACAGNSISYTFPSLMQTSKRCEFFIFQFLNLKQIVIQRFINFNFTYSLGVQVMKVTADGMFT